MSGTEKLFEIRELTKVFPVSMGFMRKKASLLAVNRFTLDIYRGETLGIVGESGCGKSTVGRLLLKLISATGGSIKYNGTDITGMSEKEFKPYRKEMQFIFQDPYASLNPRYRIVDAIAEPIEVFSRFPSRKAKYDAVAELLRNVGLTEEALTKYPHEFSGGQRQRICIARALGLHPSFIVADEPVSALDVSIQSQVINLMLDMKKQYGFTYMFISHDMGVVRYVCERIAVMYLGNIVEIADKNELFDQPLHPYTAALLAAVPEIGRKKERPPLAGEVPSPVNPPSGCVFHPRCPHACKACAESAPSLREISPGHFAACHEIKP